MRQSTVYVDPWQIWHLSHYTTHPHWRTPTHTSNQSVTHSGNSRRRACRLHRLKHTHNCSVTDGCVTPTTVVHFQVHGEQCLSEVIWGKEKAEYGIEWRRKAIDCSLGEEGMCNCTALLIWAPERPLMTKSREAAHYISAKCILHECLNSIQRDDTLANEQFMKKTQWKKCREKDWREKLRKTWHVKGEKEQTEWYNDNDWLSLWPCLLTDQCW